MIDSLLDWLIFGLAALAFLIFNYAGSRRAQRQRSAELPQAPSVPVRRVERDAAVDPYAWGRSAGIEIEPARWAPPEISTPAVRVAAPVAVVPQFTRAARIRAQLRNPRALRDAIVISTLLGPCAAYRAQSSARRPRHESTP